MFHCSTIRLLWLFVADRNRLFFFALEMANFRFLSIPGCLHMDCEHRCWSRHFCINHFDWHRLLPSSVILQWHDNKFFVVARSLFQQHDHFCAISWRQNDNLLLSEFFFLFVFLYWLPNFIHFEPRYCVFFSSFFLVFLHFVLLLLFTPTFLFLVTSHGYLPFIQVLPCRNPVQAFCAHFAPLLLSILVGFFFLSAFVVCLVCFCCSLFVQQFPHVMLPLP